MSTTAISSSAVQQQPVSFLQQRNLDLKHLGYALKAGDMATAKQAYNAIVALAKNGPSPVGAAFAVANREQDFQAIGKALHAGDMAGALQAFEALASTFHAPKPSPVMTSSSAGPDAVVTLSGNK